MASGETVCITIKWSGQEYRIDNLQPNQTILQLKELIKDKTGVLPVRQKLLGLKVKGRPPDDGARIKDLNVKPNTKIMMMGSREETLVEVIKPSEELMNNEVINDFDIEEDEVMVENREENLNKIAKRVADYKINVLNEPDEKKKLLVLDIDYTLFDHRSVAETGLELMRPYLHEFLTSAYQDYNIVIWSATSMKWIEAKMKELNMANHPDYKLCFYLDSSAMITVEAPTYGVIETKPLGVIWGKYDCFNSKNTIMFDDLRRNFLMNPQNGLKIRPFREAHFSRDSDTELLKLKKYLKDIAKLDDFSHLNHKHWEKYSR